MAPHWAPPCHVIARSHYLCVLIGQAGSFSGPQLAVLAAGLGALLGGESPAPDPAAAAEEGGDFNAFNFIPLEWKTDFLRATQVVAVGWRWLVLRIEIIHCLSTCG